MKEYGSNIYNSIIQKGDIKTIEGFKKLFKIPLLPNKYTVEFHGNFFGLSNQEKNTNIRSKSMYKTNTGNSIINRKANSSLFNSTSHGYYLYCKVSQIQFPQQTVDTSSIYLGGNTLKVPTGYSNGNVTMTILNQGIEYDVINDWCKSVYNQKTRCYGYFDEYKTNVLLTQFTTNGYWVLKHMFYGCTPYNIDLGALSYDESNQAQTFTLSLNYFSIETIYNEIINEYHEFTERNG